MAHVAEADSSTAPTAHRRNSSLGRIMRFLRLPEGDFFATAGIAIYIVFVMTALLADAIRPHDPLEILFAPDGQLLANAPEALSETKRLAMESSFGGMAVDDAAYARLVSLHSAKRQTAEAAEGLASFAEKRAGRWSANA